MSISRLFNSNQAIFVSELMKNFWIMHAIDNGKKFITFEEFLLYELKRINEESEIPNSIIDSGFTKEEQLKILYAYEDIMISPTFYIGELYEKPSGKYRNIIGDSTFNYNLSMELLNLKDNVRAKKAQDFYNVDIRSMLSQEISLSKELLFFEEMKRARITRDIRFYNMYFKNLSDELKQELDAKWEELVQSYEKSYNKLEENEKVKFNNYKEYLNKEVFQYLLNKIETEGLDLEVNYDLYDNCNGLVDIGPDGYKNCIGDINLYIKDLINLANIDSKLATKKLKSDLFRVGIIDADDNLVVPYSGEEPEQEKNDISYRIGTNKED